MDDTLIIGGGIMGCSIAFALAKEGVKVTVLERAIPGAEASSTAAGILAPSLEAKSAGPLLQLGQASRELYPALAQELREDYALEIGFRRSGAMLAAVSESELEHATSQQRVLHQAGVTTPQLFRGNELRALCPALSDSIDTGLYCPDEAQVEPPRLLRALAIAAEKRGARFVSGEIVESILAKHGQIEGVRTQRNTLRAARVILAAGSWTSLVEGTSLPQTAVTPVRGQIVECDARRPLFSQIIFGAGGYVVPRADGRVVCGSTEEDVGFRKDVTLGGLHKILSTTLALIPALRDAPWSSHTSNFRPTTSDKLPMVGELRSIRSLYVATGHYRNGILLAPITAQAIADLIIRGKTNLPLDALNPNRVYEQQKAQITP